MLRRDMAISSRMGLGGLTADQYKPGGGVGQGIFEAIFQINFSRFPPPFPSFNKFRMSGKGATGSG